jgi:beta-N-acetylhexosaminidase
MSLVCLLFAVLWIFGPASVSFSADLTVREKIGQMIMVGFRGLSVDDQSPIIRDIHAGRTGGVILFDYDVPSGSPVRNIKSPEQVRALVEALKKASSVPLFVAIDQEGGKVDRLKEKFGFPPSVSEQYLGSLNDVETTQKYARITAETLLGLGINLNFAPVVDLDVNPDNPVIGKLERSFSADPKIVIEQSLAVIDAFHNCKVLSAIKHFPGHGSSTADSHKGFVDVTNTWSPVELKPFAAIIKSGKCDIVMTAHIFNGRLDPVWPATLSYKTITGLLREELGYSGVVVSDDMQMEAIRSFYDLETAIKMSILSGTDILLFANNSVYEEDIASRAVAVIEKLISDKVISPARIDESYNRIMKLKEKLGTGDH